MAHHVGRKGWVQWQPNVSSDGVVKTVPSFAAQNLPTKQMGLGTSDHPPSITDQLRAYDGVAEEPYYCQMGGHGFNWKVVNVLLALLSVGCAIVGLFTPWLRPTGGGSLTLSDLRNYGGLTSRLAKAVTAFLVLLVVSYLVLLLATLRHGLDKVVLVAVSLWGAVVQGLMWPTVTDISNASTYEPGFWATFVAALLSTIHVCARVAESMV
eukprot:Sspe_Gene.89946::Locus_61602_Transcript_1_1_Confidence_1.000_Length_791::g.89946::m.89946